MEHPTTNIPSVNLPNLGSVDKNSPRKEQNNTSNKSIRKKKKEYLPRTPKQETNESKKDQFERINYLHQLSHLFGDTQPSLSRFYISEMCTVSKRTVSRLDATIKRSFCRNCLKLAMVAGKTKIKKSKRGSFLLNSCHHCRFVKRFSIQKKRKGRL